METPKLGQLIPRGENPGRDAVHIAVAPVTAACSLDPGERVGIMADGRAKPFASGSVGIVDPFLQEPVPAGGQFYLFLLPGTVTSLRHVWTHPAFAPKVPGK